MDPYLLSAGRVTLSLRIMTATLIKYSSSFLMIIYIIVTLFLITLHECMMVVQKKLAFFPND